MGEIAFDLCRDRAGGGWLGTQNSIVKSDPTGVSLGGNRDWR